MEMIVQNAMVALCKTFDIVGVILGTADMTWQMHLSAWIFGLFVLAIRPLTNRIPKDKFHFMDAVDLETVNANANIFTRYAERATDDFARMGAEDAEEETVNTKADSEGTKSKKESARSPL
jgi:hypothetical protein